MSDEDRAFFAHFNIEEFRGYTWFRPCLFLSSGSERVVEESMQNLYYDYFRDRECIKICDHCKQELEMSEWRHGCKDYPDTHFDVWGWVERLKPYHPDIEERGFIEIYNRDPRVHAALGATFEQYRELVLCQKCEKLKRDARYRLKFALWM